jgi:hypothetical protein
MFIPHFGQIGRREKWLVMLRAYAALRGCDTVVVRVIGRHAD